MAATACAYGFDTGRRPPMPALQVMASFDDDDDDRGRRCSIINDHGCVVHGVVMPPPPAPPPPPPPPPPLPPPPRSRHPGLCTEGLGSESSESSGDLDLGGTVADDGNEDCKSQQQGHSDDQEETPTPARARGGKRVFPPPISVIGAAGKPWQYLRAQRGGGRLVLREVRIPSRELLHACREDGRLKLHFAHPEPEERRHHHLADDQECICNN